MLLQIVSVLLLMISTVFCTPAGDKQNNMQPVRKDKSMPDTRGTLDPIGGGNLLKLVDSYKEEESSWMQTLLKIGLPIYWLGDKFFTDKDQQNSTKQQPVHKDKPETDTRGTLDPLGGGNFVRLVDNYREDEPSLIKKMAVTMYVLEKILFHKNSQPNITQPVHKEKPQPDTRGTLDPLGGDNFVRLDESYREEPSLIKKIAIAMSLYEWYFFHHNDQQNITEQPVRKEKPQPDTRGTLDSLGGGNFVRSEQAVGGGRQNMARLAREDKSQKTNPVLKLVDPYRNEQIYRSLDRAHFLESLDNFQGGEVLRILEAVTGGDLLSSLDPTEGMAVLTALRSTHTKHPKRMLDSVSGWSFGESKRNFDEIDNVGFNGFAKRSPYQHLAGGNSRNFLSSLAKKNFDEIDRAGFETYNKRDFDEIDRTGFENFQKRDRKE